MMFSAFISAGKENDRLFWNSAVLCGGSVTAHENGILSLAPVSVTFSRVFVLAFEFNHGSSC